MPTAFVALSVLLQGACFGYLSGRLTTGGSLLLSCFGFGLSALLFTGVAAVRRLRAGGRPPARYCRRAARRLLWLMNAVTAVTFLSFYAALAWVPATLASGLETAVGPFFLALFQLLRPGGARPGARAWTTAGVLAAVGALLAWRMTGGAAAAGWSSPGGLALVVVAGAGASALALISKSLGSLGVPPVTVSAHRFHLTYAGAALLFLAQGRPPDGGGVPLALLPLIGVAAVTLPLFVLQVGLQRAGPMAAMTVLTTLPGVTYLFEAAWGGEVDAPALGLTVLMVALVAADTARPARPARERREAGQRADRQPPAAERQRPGPEGERTAPEGERTAPEGEREGAPAGARQRPAEGVRAR